ncbi:MAG: cytochrome b [Pseudomonadota bacterium]
MTLSARSVVLFVGLFSMNSTFASEAISLAAGGTGTSTRMEGDLDSWVAIGIVLASLATAWCMNAAAPKVRSLGTLLASLGCFAVALWFLGFVAGTGFLENPKPNQTPLDSAKPALLWMQGSVALIAGMFLLFVGFRQFSSQALLSLPRENESQRYGAISRFLHWTTAILFIVLIPMGMFASIIPEGTEYRNAYYVVHKTIGVLVFVLLLARLIWHSRSKRPVLDEALRPFERKAAHSAHIALYFFLIALPVTGFVMTSYHGYPTFFFFWELPPLWTPSDTATIIWGTLHKYLLPYILYIVLGAHILGALKHHYVDKHHDAIKRMVG